ncbi:SMI1 (YGR229C) [Zygosaccharomyces parabailii]|nr:SMI1 (YGR229C) [Zygosaccharomyces parabailii]
MNVLKKKWNELVYSLSTGDHYAEYNARDPVAFNMGRRANTGANGSRVRLTSSTDDLRDDEMRIGMEDGGEEIDIDEFASSDTSGVSETLLAWKHIDLWTTEHNPDLNATLGDPCTHNDITNAEEDLAVAFPSAVKVSFRVHDGQEDLESLAGTSGLIYGLQLMSLDQVVEMTEKWRSVSRNIVRRTQQAAAAAAAAAASSASPTVNQMTPEGIKRRQFKLPHIPEQKSVPVNTIQPVYAHPGWIPLVTDHAGNHIAVDLAPAPSGKYAQVILFGRDFDTKYVIADNWGDFLLAFANDLEAGNWYLVDDNDDFLSGDGELAFRDKKTNGPVQDYLEVLKRRAIQRDKEIARTNQETIATSNGDVKGTSFFDDESMDESSHTVTHKDLPELVDTKMEIAPKEQKLGEEVSEELSSAMSSKKEPEESSSAQVKPNEEPNKEAKEVPKEEPEMESQKALGESQDGSKEQPNGIVLPQEELSEALKDESQEGPKVETDNNTSQEAEGNSPGGFSAEPKEIASMESKEELKEEPEQEPENLQSTGKTETIEEKSADEVKSLKEEFESVAL